MSKTAHIRSRPTNKDIFHPNSDTAEHIVDRKFGEPIERIATAYTIFGRHYKLDSNGNPLVEDENDTLAFAKSVTIQNKPTRYYVKSDPTGKYHNPMGLDEGTHAKRKPNINDEYLWQFREVNKKTFDFYVLFLRTKNPLYHICAQREGF